MTETICPVCGKAMETNICDNCKYDSTKEFPTELERFEYVYTRMEKLFKNYELSVKQQPHNLNIQ